MAKAEKLEFPLAGALTEETLRAMLEGFRLRRLPRQTLTPQILDTFDWRLHGAGLGAMLDHGELRLIRLTDGRESGRCAAGEPPLFVSDLAHEALRARLAELVAMRALLTAARLRIVRITYAVLNDDDKTVARVRLEDRRFFDAAGNRTRPRERVLVLEPVRGYGAIHKALRKTLGARLTESRPPRDLHGDALATCSRRPGDARSVQDIVLDPGGRADAGMKTILASLRDAMTEHEAGMLANLDSEFLHDYRVAVRRTRSALSQVKGVFATSVTTRFKVDFAWLGAITSPARDMDVYLLALDDFRALLDPPLRPHLDTLGAFLEERRAAEYARLGGELSRARYRRFMAAWSGFLHRPVAGRPTSPNGRRRIKDVADERIWKMYRRVMKAGRAIHGDSPAAELHELRKSCKKLRYLMEFFNSLYPADEIGRLIGRLKRFQDNLGLFQDLSVQMAHLTGFEQALADEGRLAPGTRDAIHQLQARLGDQRGEVRSAFDQRFEAFSKNKIRRSFGRLFNAAGT